MVTLAANTANQIYSIGVSSFNSTAVGIIFVSAGTLIYSSTNWGATWGSTGISLNVHGGNLIVPYSVTGGGGNGGTTPQFFAITGDVAGALQGRAMDTTSHQISAGAGTGLTAAQQVCSYALDGNSLYIVFAGLMYYSADGGKTWTINSMGASANNFVNTWPTNNQFAICGGATVLRYTANAGAAFTDLYTAYDTFRSGAYGSGGTNIKTAFGDLAQQYPKPVTQ
jgi:hypothetical protein